MSGVSFPLQAQKFIWVKGEKPANYLDYWTNPYFEPSGSASAESIAYDEDNNLYVTGKYTGKMLFENSIVTSTLSEWPGYLAKYDIDGQLLWMKFYELMDAENDYYRLIASNKKKDIYVGITFNGQMTLSNGDVIPAIPNGNFFRVIIIKYDQDGNIVWYKLLASASAPNSPHQGTVSLSAMDVDPAGNLYLQTKVFGKYDLGDGVLREQSIYGNGLAVVKIDPNGNFIWATEFQPNEQHNISNFTIPRSLGQCFKVNAQGECFIITDYSSHFNVEGKILNFNDDTPTLLTKLDAKGKYSWHQLIVNQSDILGANAAYINGGSSSLLLDSGGNPYFCANYNSKPLQFSNGTQIQKGITDPYDVTSTNVFMLKMSKTDGKILWVKNFPNEWTYNINNVSIDQADNFYFTGRFYKKLDLENQYLWANYSWEVFVFKTDSQGKVIWTNQTHLSEYPQESPRPKGIISLPDGNVYIVGKVKHTSIFNCNVVDAIGAFKGAPFLTKIIQGPINIKPVESNNSQFCQGSGPHNLGVKNIVGATKYIWLPPDNFLQASGSLITNTPNLTDFSISYTAPLGKTKIPVLAYNDCWDLLAQGTIEIEILPSPGLPEIPQGPSVICKGQTYTFQVSPVSYTEKYDWELPNGVVPVNSTHITTTNQITLLFTENSTNGFIRVRGVNTRCGNGRYSYNAYFQIKPPLPVPEKPQGLNKVCQGQKDVLYKIPALLNVQGYVWKLPLGVTSTSGSNVSEQPEIRLNFANNFTGGSIQVAAKGDCGEGNFSLSLSIEVIPIPANAQNIQVFSQACAGSTLKLQTAPLPNANEYIWTLPNGQTQVSAQPEISFTVPNQGSILSFEVAGKNDCGQLGLPSPKLQVNLIPKLPPAGNIQGTSQLCVNSTAIYEISPIAGAESYLWELPNGVSIIEGVNTNKIKVSFSPQAQSGYFRVWAKNTCFEGEKSEKFRVEVTPDKPNKPTIKLLCDGLESSQLANYQWFKDNQPITGAIQANYLIKAPGVYFVRTENICGFTDSEPITFERNECKTEFVMPTAFSPNGDGLNDYWEIVGRNFSNLNLSVYNRWGEIIFMARKPDDKWDGTYNGKPVPVGTYVWKASLESTVEKGQKIQKSGSITVVR
jgi:gliding motility-associated-like protein